MCMLAKVTMSQELQGTVVPIMHVPEGAQARRPNSEGLGSARSVVPNWQRTKAGILRRLQPLSQNDNGLFQHASWSFSNPSIIEQARPWMQPASFTTRLLNKLLSIERLHQWCTSQAVTIAIHIGCLQTWLKSRAGEPSVC